LAKDFQAKYFTVIPVCPFKIVANEAKMYWNFPSWTKGSISSSQVVVSAAGTGNAGKSSTINWMVVSSKQLWAVLFVTTALWFVRGCESWWGLVIKTPLASLTGYYSIKKVTVTGKVWLVLIKLFLNLMC
jgi:hypothetical protein